MRASDDGKAKGIGFLVMKAIAMPRSCSGRSRDKCSLMQWRDDPASRGEMGVSFLGSERRSGYFRKSLVSKR